MTLCGFVQHVERRRRREKSPMVSQHQLGRRLCKKNSGSVNVIAFVYIACVYLGVGSQVLVNITFNVITLHINLHSDIQRPTYAISCSEEGTL